MARKSQQPRRASAPPSAPIPAGGRRRNASLTAREREILGLLAAGLSGADIAGHLVLSPETVRTHVRNAMAKLGASTRSQAVALALQRSEIVDLEDGETPAAPPRAGTGGERQLGATTASFAAVHDHLSKAVDLEEIVAGLVTMHEIDAASVYLTEEDGMTLRRAASDGETDTALTTAAEVIALGDGPIGRIALERRAQVVRLDHPAAASAQARAAVVAPMVAGRLVGVLCFAVRASRPAGRGELLLSQAFATRLAELLTDGRNGGVERRLTTALERFRASWTATIGA